MKKMRAAKFRYGREEGYEAGHDEGLEEGREL